tara:strand:- start:3859 stop:4065 length:207 start_codon:yes stop_codon:yes gene_type:complete
LSRLWEPANYESIKDQDENLNILSDWVAEYEEREDEFSFREHLNIFNEFLGIKIEITKMKELEPMRWV